MSGFEAPINNPEIAERAQGISRLGLQIALDPLKQERLHDFTVAHIDRPSLQFMPAGPNPEHYDYRYFSGIGEAGTMVHVRKHRQGDEPVPPELDFAVVTDSIHGDESLQTATAITTVRRSHTYWGGIETDILLGSVEEPDYFLQAVDEGVTEDEWLEEQLRYYLEDESELMRMGMLRMSPQGWLYRHPNGLLEPLRDLADIRREVRLTINRGLATAAFASVNTTQLQRKEEKPDTGHIDEKVLVYSHATK